ncbi:META domain-containing protein [Rathayibacter sp. VKM Ac-2803]|uniref:META domain-containing protein n=1 Tax=unclassified Rathayibacter TaxID=2609250 RepID=UPI00135A80B7|nr:MULTISPECIES: META domain-containing protein [unclassified Rathayibacter]MWV48080.1 META domain-containing protein [Rathayibacter sp. VKM Ac-2803]MWV58702.1 META domain-containing protein [Rathayibacter sp. VKM Ac-2754]
MSRRRTTALLLTAGSLAAALVACTADREAPTPTTVAELEPGEYRSTSLSGTLVDAVTDPAASILLVITRDGGDRLTIDDGCNTQSGPFRLDDGVLTVTRLSTTFVACEPPRDEAGALVSGLLSEPVSVARSGGEMTWTNPLGEIVFVEAD